MPKRDEIAEIIARAMRNSKAWPVVFEAGSAAALAAAALAALGAAGLTVVPKEPTPEMLAHGQAAGQSDDLEPTTAEIEAIYRAMLAAVRE